MKFIKLIYRFIRDFFEHVLIFFICLVQNDNFLSELYQTCDELYITHMFAGGTFTYEQNYLKNKKNIFVFRSVKGKKTRYFLIENKNTNKRYFLQIRQLSNFFLTFKKINITVSSLVSYTCIEEILIEIINLKKRTDLYICYLVHDFHCVCPNYTLINKEGYCHLHCSSKCNYSLRIKQWRSIWYHFLSEIDEIRVFSQSSKNVITNVYPRIPQGVFAVVPHDMSYCKFKPYEISDNKEKRLAIVGTCDTIAKGKEIVNDFLVKYQDRGVVIFGKTPLRRKAKKNRLVINYGKYINSELPSLMQRYNVDTVVFPSICEETFSYTVSELMLLNVNIVCFNIGAQAEKVKSYKNGFIADQMTTESLIITVRNVY